MSSPTSEDQYASPFWWLQAFTVATTVVRLIGFYLTWLRLDEIDDRLAALARHQGDGAPEKDAASSEAAPEQATRPLSSARWLMMKRRRDQITPTPPRHPTATATSTATSTASGATENAREVTGRRTDWMSPSEADPEANLRASNTSSEHGAATSNVVAPSDGVDVIASGGVEAVVVAPSDGVDVIASGGVEAVVVASDGVDVIASGGVEAVVVESVAEHEDASHAADPLCECSSQ